MDSLQKSIDLDLWQNAELIQRQNLLKSQFLAILENVANAFSIDDFQKISSNSKGIKISKGNDLLGFPYQVLDLIRDFDPENGANIRLLNWFGNGFFVTILLGRKRKNPIQEFCNLGYSFGLSENQWDYPDLILNKNQTREVNIISATEMEFYHWIKVFEVDSEPSIFEDNLKMEIKKILGILALS